LGVAWGARSLAAAVVLPAAEALAPGDRAAVRDFSGAGVVLHRGDPRGTVSESTSS
jgi:hypothetical protein